MATTAGSITVSLLMATGQFETDTKRAEQIAKKRAEAIDKAFEDMGQKIGIAAGVAGTAIAAMVASTANAAKEISNLAQISGAGTQEFQRFAAGAKSVGLEQDKLGDIFKDFREKVGEFVSTGGGGMKDFFEQVAPKIGITADAFRNLSGPQALQLYFSSLEKAGLSSEEMSFYLESMASDTSALIPLLRNGGIEMGKLGDAAEATGQIMSDNTILAAKEMSKQMTEVMGIMRGVTNETAGALIPAIVEVTKQMKAVASDGQTVSNVANGIAIAFEAVAALGVNVAYVLKQTGNELGGLAAQAAAVARGDFSQAAAIGQMMRDDSAAARAQVEKDTAAILNAQQKIIGGGTGVRGAGFVDPRIIGGGPKPWKQPTKQGAAPKSGKAEAFTDPLADSAKLYASSLMAMDKAQISALMSGEKLTATQQKMLDIFADPAFKDMPDTWKEHVAAQGELAISLEQAAVQSELLAQQQERLNELLGLSQLEKQREDMALLAKAYEDGKITVEEYGLAVKNALGLGDEKGGYWEEWLKSAETAMGSFDELAGDVVKNFSSQFGSAFEKMIFDSDSLGDAVSGMAESMARSVVNALGQMAAQWLTYQAVQMIAGKTAASAAATAVSLDAQAMATMAGLNAFASTAAIPIVGPAMAPGAMAAALSVSTPLAATIASLSAAAAGARQSGGPVTGNTPYLVGERGAELFVPNTSGAIVPNSKLGGGNVTVNMIEDKSRAGQTQERTNNGQKELDVFVADIMGDGPRSKAMKQAFGLQRRGY